MSKLKTDIKYNPSLIESKWQAIWEKEKIYSPNLDKAEKPFYNLMMFPYPSAEGMHVGNMYAFTGSDVYGRFQRMQGKTVFEPIGLDGFGIHSENYAIKIGKNPMEQAKISEKNFYRQLKSIGNGFDWTRTVETYKPEFYKWTQWLFIQLFKAGLAYRKKAPVNFCPSCKTVLSDEQVIEGKCERCESEVVKKDLEQWFFKITEYADRLLSGLSQIDWSEKVKTAQKLWIGKSEGARVKFKIKDSDREVEVFTTRPDTLFGATFLVLSPEHPIVASLLKIKNHLSPEGEKSKIKEEINKYVEDAKRKTERERGEGKEKAGVFTGVYAINPVNQEKIPVWIADYAIMGYGTGALFGDAHDERDAEFANKYGIALKPTLITGNKERDKQIMDLKECFTGYGILINSGEFSGLKSEEAKKKITEWLSKNASGGPKTTYHLRDWLISRQRYWGPPIPLVFCENCAQKLKNQKSNLKNKEYSEGEIENLGWIAVEEANLPVELPFIKDYKPLGTGVAPLASHPEFYKITCPKCGGKAKRETDVSDTFLDSSWYFLRYLATDRDDIPFPSEAFSEYSENSVSQNVRKSDTSDNQKFRSAESSEFSEIEKRSRWLPVSMYIGGAEHSVLHLLYSRFMTMALHDLGLINFEEPFTQFRAHGLIVKDGAKMSKSKGNVVIPDAYIKKFGADALRTYLMFMGPFSQGGNFRDTGIEGMHRFLRRVWTLFQCHPEFISGSPASRQDSLRTNEMPKQVRHDTGRLQMMHKTIKKVTEDISNLSYNTSIAALMEYYNFLSSQKYISISEFRVLLKLLAPFAPHISEELYQLLSDNNKFSSIHLSQWPTYEPKLLKISELVVVVQINGKLRGSMLVDQETVKDKVRIEELAQKDGNVAKHLESKQIKKVIYIEGKVINFVVN